jgi:hypothetical protein
LNHFGAKRRAIFECRKTYGRPQVGERSQFPPQSKQTTFGPQLFWDIVECRASDCAQQRGAGGKTSLRCILRQRVVAARIRGAADIFFLQAEFVSERGGDGLENTNGFIGDFGTDAVAGEDGDLQEHGFYCSAGSEFGV